MTILDELRALGAPVLDPVGTAAYIAVLNMSNSQKARLLRSYLRETRQGLTREILVEARDYSFHL